MSAHLVKSDLPGIVADAIHPYRIKPPLGTHIWVAVSIFIASIAVAYASVKVYDLPIRAWLSEKFIYNRKKS